MRISDWSSDVCSSDLNKDWGGKPLEDLKLGLAAAAAKDAHVDAGNGCALGASYGGYMMNWIAGNWPDGFKCLVQHDGVFDARAMAYETEELWFDEWEHGGPYHENPQEFEKRSEEGRDGKEGVRKCRCRWWRDH